MSMELIDTLVSLDQLMLDPGNYRLDYKADGQKYLDDEVLRLQPQTQEKLEKDGFGELRDSMLTNGFLEMDRIAVRKLDTDNTPNLYLVIEGNRRTAAFKSLLDDHSKGLMEIPNTLIAKSKKINVVLLEGPLDQIRNFGNTMMGVRHVAGPKRWRGVLSAKLIQEMYDSGESISDIAKTLGISAVDAGRRRRGYRAFLQMKQYPKYADKIQSNFYALLLEFVSKSAAKKWLDWDDNDSELKFNNIDNLKIVYSKLVGEKESLSKITSPAQARDFIKYLEFPEYCSRIEEGESYKIFPSIESNIKPKKIIKDFLNLIDGVADEDLSSFRDSNERDLTDIKNNLDKIFNIEE